MTSHDPSGGRVHEPETGGGDPTPVHSKRNGKLIRRDVECGPAHSVKMIFLLNSLLNGTSWSDEWSKQGMRQSIEGAADISTAPADEDEDRPLVHEGSGRSAAAATKKSSRRSQRPPARKAALPFRSSP